MNRISYSNKNEKKGKIKYKKRPSRKEEKNIRKVSYKTVFCNAKRVFGNIQNRFMCFVFDMAGVHGDGKKQKKKITVD